MTPTENRVSVLEVGHRMLIGQHAEIMIAMAEAKSRMSVGPSGNRDDGSARRMRPR